MTTLDTGIMDVPLPRKRSVIAFAAAASAIAGFVAVSLALKSVAQFALVGLGLVEDSYGACAEYVLVTALAMYVVRKAFDWASIKYSGKIIFGSFLAISLLTMAFAISSGVMKIDFLVSLFQMAALCVFAYLQFWAHDGPGRRV